MTSGHDMTKLSYLELAKRELRQAQHHAERAAQEYDSADKYAFHVEKLKARMFDAKSSLSCFDQAPRECSCSQCAGIQKDVQP